MIMSFNIQDSLAKSHPVRSFIGSSAVRDHLSGSRVKRMGFSTGDIRAMHSSRINWSCSRWIVDDAEVIARGGEHFLLDRNTTSISIHHFYSCVAPSKGRHSPRALQGRHPLPAQRLPHPLPPTNSSSHQTASRRAETMLMRAI
jgi:hypothetical protein